MKRCHFLSALLAGAMLFCLLPTQGQAQLLHGRKSPKNIIIMISDGWGYNQIQATNAWHDGAFETQPYEHFPVDMFMSTYPAKTKDAPELEYWNTGYNSEQAWADFEWVMSGATGSAPAATSMATGFKSYYKGIGVDVDHNPLRNITERAEQLGKAAGVVTSVQWTHATPAAFVAHNVHRDHYDELGREMLLDSKLSVIMGAGHPMYDNNGKATSGDFDYKYVGGEDAWNGLVGGKTTYGVAANSANTTVQDIDDDGYPDPWTLIETREDFQNLMSGDTPLRVVGTPRVYETLQQSRGETDGKEDAYSVPFNSGIPTLEEMTRGALNVLDNDADGFFLMVEGGAVDWSGHANQPGRLIEEQHDFNNAVKAVIAWIEANGGWEENLLVVTGDHETGYLTGPKENDNSPITNPVVNNGKGQMPDMKYNSGGHTNQLIPFYAKGLGSDLFDLYADEVDYLWGSYVNNTELGLACLTLWPDPTTEVRVPENIIVLISDGWGYNEIQATNAWHDGDFHTQAYEQFPVNLFMSTYPAKTKDDPSMQYWATGYNSFKTWSDFDWMNHGATGSAPAATSMATGFKSYYKGIGVDVNHNALFNITQQGEEMGKATGVVTSVEWTHATPAAFVAHNVHRDHYDELGREMLLDSKADVIMGAGHPMYDNSAQPKSEDIDYKYVGGEDAWNCLINGRTEYNVPSNEGRTKVQDADGDGYADAWTFIEDLKDFESLITSSNPPKRVIGIPKVYQTLQQSRGTTDGKEDAYSVPFNEGIPTLEEMTRGALNVLDEDPDGFFLMVEGGAVDWTGHANQPGRLIEEQHDFNNTVDAVIEWVEANSSWDKTLVIVTGDHETGYLTGPKEEDQSPVTNPVVNNGRNQMPGMRYNSGGHTNQLIPFYAKGAGSELFPGYADEFDYLWGRYLNNTELGQAMMYLWRGKANVVTGIRHEAELVPTTVILQSNYPNPFNPSTTLSYALPQQMHVRLSVHDQLGRRVAVLSEGQQPAGTHSLTWNAHEMCSGLYLAVLEADGIVLTGKMLLTK